LLVETPVNAAVVLQLNCTTSVPPATGGLASAQEVVVVESSGPLELRASLMM
jgi:hypothetical protein